MKAKRFQSAFMVLFLLLFQAQWSFAVVADANIVQRLRQMKSDELTVLRFECNDTQKQIRQCRIASIVSEKSESSHDKSSDKSNRRNGQRPPKMTFKSREEKIQKLKELNDELAKLQQNISAIEANDLKYIIPVFDSSFYIGKFGRLGDNTYGGYLQKFTHQQRFKIISIIDEDNSIVEYEISSYFTKFNSLGMGAGRSEMITKTVWLRGISTKGKITGSGLRPSTILIITGTQDYENLMGAKQTVYVFEPLMIDPNVL